MIQKTGPGRFIDHGPQKPYPGARSIIGGTDLASAIVTSHAALRGSAAIGGHAGTPREKRAETPEEAAARKLRAKVAFLDFKRRHTGCPCHEMYGGQPRPVGYRERERDRDRLRRELRRDFEREQAAS